MRPCAWNATVSLTSIPVAGPRRFRPTSRSMRREYKFMNTTSELTIVIPAKNEARLLPRLLHSLTQQDYPNIANTKLFVADAASTDQTAAIALSFRGRLDVEVIAGGFPSVGRNLGARRAETKYLLFVDADIELDDPTLVR